MFGYITVNRGELKIKEFDLYRSYYCGICHTLKNRYGRAGQILLNYDMTFLAILLSGLYEPEEEKGRERCLPHPGRPHPYRINEASEYAADMTILLGVMKARDDWDDEKSLPGAGLSLVLGRAYRRVKEQYPRQAKALEESVAGLDSAQKEGITDLDEVSAYTGRFMAEICAWKEDFWKETLETIGFYLGKYIYLADAYEDLEEDEEKNNYNPLKKLREEDPAHFEETIEQILTDTVSLAASAFEQLPILRRREILRNILYSGLWTRVAAAKKKRAGAKAQNGTDKGRK